MARVRKATGPTRKGATETVPEERVEEETPFEAVESPSKDSDNETQPSSMGDDNDSQSEIESYKIDTDIDFKYNPNFFEDKKALESVLRNTMGFGDIHVKSLQNEGLKTANDFLLISMSDINDLCDKLLFATVYRARLRAFATWLRSQPDNINITQEWTIPVMQLEMQMKAQASPFGTSETNKTDKSVSSLVPDPFDGTQKKWLAFRYSFEAWAGASGQSFDACISHDSERYSRSEPTATYNDINDEPDSFKYDWNVKSVRNSNIFFMLKSLTSGGDAWGLIEPYEVSKNGRHAWIALCAFYEGASQVGLTTEEARTTILTSKYTGQSRNFTFTKYVQKHLTGNNILARNKEAYTDSQKTNFFLRGIVDPELMAFKAAAEANLNEWKFERVVTYMRTQAAKLTSKDGKDSRNIRQATGLSKNRNNKNNRRKRSEYQSQGKGNKESGKGNNAPSTQLRKDIWDELSPEIKDAIKAAKRRASTDPRTAKRAKTSSTDNSNASVESYSPDLRSMSTEIFKADDDKDLASGQPEAKDTPLHLELEDTLKKPTYGAGTLFGRSADRVSFNRMVCSSEENKVTPWRMSELRLADATIRRICKNRTRNPTGRSTWGEAAIDTGADTICIGSGYTVLAHTGRYVSLRGFHDSGDTLDRIPVVTAATAYDYDDGTTVILVFHEALNLGPTQSTSLINLNQIRHAGHQTDDIPKFLSQGKSLHGIETIDGDYIPFELKGRTSLLYSRVPTRHELENCLHIDLTSDQPWDPNSKDWEDNEQRYTRHDRQRNARYTATDNADEENFYHGYFSLPDSKEFPVLPANNNVMNPHDVVREIKYATARVSKSSPRDLDVDRDKLRRILGHVPMEVVDRTLEATTQLAERSGKMPLHRRFKTKFEQLRYRRLKCTLYSDTFKSTVKSSRGHTHTQGFVCGDSYFVYHFLMKAESEADQGLASIIQDIGIPAQIHTDNAKVETLSKWKKITSGHWIKVTVTEPYSPWQNRCEHEFGAVRIQTRLVMETTQCPEQLWDYAITYVVIVRNNTARKALNWQTPLTVMTGDTSDISELLDFEFYEPVQYFDNPEIKFPQAKAKVGRWLGIATNVGQAMCYYVLTDKGTVIARSTVTPLHKVDSTALQTSLTAFDAMIRDIYQPTDFAHSTKKQAASLRRDEAMKVARKTGEPEDPGVRNRHVLYDLNEGADHDQVEPGLSVDDYYGNDDEKESGSSDLLVGSEVLLTKGGIQHLGKVTKRDKNGQPKGSNETTNYVVEFNDGTEEIHGYNALLDAVYKQVDDDGNEWYTFEDIVDHQRRPRGGRGRTKGWFLRVKWANGEYTWEPLTSLKESNPYPVAKYAADNELMSEKAFSYWAPSVLTKADRWIRAARTRKKKNRYKYGIEVPRNVAHAYELDKQNGNHLWAEAIQKEMGTLQKMETFTILSKGERAPKDYKRIPMWIIFDVKMDFRRKARLVAGGHVTDPPTDDTYSSVASRESVRLGFLLASLNNLDLVSVDIGNAYVNADCREKVYAIAGPEFEEFEGRTVIIAKALYGLKSSGAAWHSHLAQSLRTMGFVSSKADPDMWYRAAKRKDESEYYEYIISYVDDLTVVSENTRAILEMLKNIPYTLKGGSAPETFLGATIGTYTFKDGTSAWYMSAQQYLTNAIKNIEETLGLKLSTSNRIVTPLIPGYHPEVDTSAFLDDDRANFYMSLIGILLWTSELGRIDITQEVGLMSRFNAKPREGHYNAVLRMFSYLKRHLNSKLVCDPKMREFSQVKFSDPMWKEQYPNAVEELPPAMPKPMGRSVQITVFVDAAHADCHVTRRSTTGILIFINGTPIRWYSKRQNTVEGSTYGSEFVAMRIASEMIIALRYNLRVLGVPLCGPANVFCDNMSVVTSSTIPSSVLKKKHNAISYHKVRECIASGTMRLAHEPTGSNLSDMLTKCLSGPQHKFLISHILF
ncbi:predicted protein [Phaeodactylum tricornutum CCAP 1055/1]|uniref:Integrase catalytic domain-containing protein n=2 Tax=Phaeodactylum tricornutum (strain CCAP 1055/1) TaxID=556484 RepID=B7S3K6_PHATC|nr:predicted protein [Phaeodactylum tricornutum CCAP 1055/1]EEC42861.1 predicted protein [Phaeodactylum tricornutum CCAP 1055/1]|eukprot:XP_002176154.1 predicted protein [Phaeodactylum tricornutum CCAP 1055/1]